MLTNSDAQDALKQAARKLSQGSVADLVEDGFIGMTIPTDYGDRGRSYREAALVIEEIAKACWSAMRTCLPSETAPRRFFAR